MNCSSLLSLSTHPLFSCIITLCILVFLYLPRGFIGIVYSPVTLITGALLLSLFKIGETQQRLKTQNNNENGEKGENRGTQIVEPEESDILVTQCGIKRNSMLEENFVGWNVRAPLEIIYEKYEGEEEEEASNDEKDPTRISGIERYASLSFYYPDTDSDSDSDSFSESDFPVGDWVSPGNMGLEWEEEERDELIEINLKHGGYSFYNKFDAFDSQGGEENLIEIDISGER